MRRLQLTAADALAACIGGLIGMMLTLGIAEALLRRAAQR